MIEAISQTESSFSIISGQSSDYSIISGSKIHSIVKDLHLDETDGTLDLDKDKSDASYENSAMSYISGDKFSVI